MLGVVRALAMLDPAGFGLDDACAQLEGIAADLQKLKLGPSELRAADGTLASTRRPAATRQ